MADPKRLIDAEPIDQISSLEVDLLRSLEPTGRERDEIFGSVMAQVTLTASAATATALVASEVAASKAGLALSAAQTTSTGAAVATTSASVATGGAGTTILTSFATKWGVGTLLAAAAVGVPVYLTGSGESAQVPVNAPTIPAPVSVEVERAPVVESAERSEPEAEVKEGEAVEGTTTTKKSARPAAKTSSLVEEDRLLRQARAFFKEGKFDAALSTLARLEARYPKGVLSQEREVLRISILKESGKNQQAEQRAESFRKQFPDSPYDAPSGSQGPASEEVP